MSPAAGRILTDRNAKVMPTARASMLVATASSSMVFTPKSSFISSSGEKDSLIMLPPMRLSSPKATQ